MTPIWIDVLDEVARTCVANGRVDLLPWLRQKRAHLLKPELRVLVVGEPKQGKSLLINALINAPACPVADGVTAMVPAVVRYSPQPQATLVRAATPITTAQQALAAGEATGTLIPVAQIPMAVAGKLDCRPAEALHVEVGLPRVLLRAGLVLIDAPGLGEAALTGLPSSATVLSLVDTVLIVSDSARELSAAELETLRQAVRLHPSVVLVQTKIDLFVRWRAVAERKQQQLAEAGIPAAVVPVSAALRLQAASTGDHQLNAESGIASLIALLRQDLAGKAGPLARRSVTLIARRVVEELAAPLRAELLSQQEQEQAGPMARLHTAQREIDELRRSATRWQNTLSDELADLLADAEYHLRDRLRQIMRVVNEAFDEADPVANWPAFEQWLGCCLREEAQANRAWLAERCAWTARRVAGSIARYTDDALPAWSIFVPADSTDQLPMIRPPATDPFTVSQKIFAGLRNSYAGLLMFGLTMTLAGMPMINPVSVGAGVIFAGKGIHDEGKVLLRRRQAAAKAAVQQYVDGFHLRLIKECRETVRPTQRLLRDHFAALTDELHASIVESLRRAKKEADIEAASREQRRREIQQRLTGLGAVYTQAQRLDAAPASAMSLGLRL